MIRPLHPIDAFRLALLGGPGTINRAHTLASLSNSTGPRSSKVAAARLSLSLQGKSVCSWASVNSNRVLGIVASKPRSGPKSWEVTHCLMDPDADPNCADVLTKVCQGAAGQGAERVFIRLRSDDPMVELSETCGFAVCTHELLYKGQPRISAGSESITTRQKRPSDDYDLFRLYNASTPSKTRFATGMTFDQWTSSQERVRGRPHGLVYENDGQIRGWVLARKRPTGLLTIMVHPESQNDVAAVLEAGLAHMKEGVSVYCLVPDHQVLLGRLLSQRGFESVSEYVTLVRPTAASAKVEKARQPVTIASA